MDANTSVIHLAAANGSTNVLLSCLENGERIDSLNREPPLEIASNTNIIRVLLDFASGYKGSNECVFDKKTVSLSPFRELPSGPASYLFWTAIGVGKDNYIFRQYGLYPYDWLTDTERILLLTEVAEAMSGYTELKRTLLNECALYAVFAFMKSRIKKELDNGCEGDGPEPPSRLCTDSTLWRKRVMEAYEQVYDTKASFAGLNIDCCKKNVWNTVINLLARSLFGESFWEKQKMFSTHNASERQSFLQRFSVPEGYFHFALPPTATIPPSTVQLTFKKLLTMSKNFLCEEPLGGDSSGCFCPECIAEREVPLNFKLQFLDEAAEENKKNKKARKKNKPGKKDDSSKRKKLDELLSSRSSEVKKFWNSLSLTSKWQLTELPLSELQDVISTSSDWEMLRSAVHWYSGFQHDDDILEFSEDSVTLIDDSGDMLTLIFDALRQFYTHSENEKRSLSHEEWENRSRKELENLVLCEFARKIAAQYVLKKEENRAQRVQQEIEAELLEEEEQQQRAAEKKAKRKKSKAKKKSKKKDDSESEDDAETKVQVRGTSKHVLNSSIIEDVPIAFTGNNPFAMLDTKKPAPKIEVKKRVVLDLPVNIPEIVTPQVTSNSKKQRKEKKKQAKLLKEKETREAAAKAAEITEAKSVESKQPVPAVMASVNRAIPSSGISADSWYNKFSDGMLFLCTDDTIAESFHLGLFGLPQNHLNLVKTLKPHKSALFLFNITSKQFYGVYEATSEGRELIQHNAWSRSSRSSPFPSQVSFKIAVEFQPLPDILFRQVLPDGNRARKLNSSQVVDMIRVFMELSSPMDIESLPPYRKKPRPKVYAEVQPQQKEHVATNWNQAPESVSWGSSDPWQDLRQPNQRRVEIQTTPPLTQTQHLIPQPIESTPPSTVSTPFDLYPTQDSVPLAVKQPFQSYGQFPTVSDNVFSGVSCQQPHYDIYSAPSQHQQPSLQQTFDTFSQPTSQSQYKPPFHDSFLSSQHQLPPQSMPIQQPPLQPLPIQQSTNLQQATESGWNSMPSSSNWPSANFTQTQPPHDEKRPLTLFGEWGGIWNERKDSSLAPTVSESEHTPSLVANLIEDLYQPAPSIDAPSTNFSQNMTKEEDSFLNLVSNLRDNTQTSTNNTNNGFCWGNESQNPSNSWNQFNNANTLDYPSQTTDWWTSPS